LPITWFVPSLRSLLLPSLAAALAESALIPSTAPARVTAADASAPVLVVGDSLAVGLRPYLGDLLGTTVAWDAKSGRTTPQGLVALRGALKMVQPKTVVVSLGTNDGSDPTRFKDRIDKVVATIGPKACIVWTNIYRPARKGPYVALNGVLDQEAARVRRLHLVDWNSAVARRAVTLPDGLHPDPAGFEYRSRMIANAVKDQCGGGVIGDVVDGTAGGGATTDGTGGVAAPS
jgi:lysophospholipase L1-like esterase